MVKKQAWVKSRNDSQYKNTNITKGNQSRRFRQKDRVQETGKTVINRNITTIERSVDLYRCNTSQLDYAKARAYKLNYYDHMTHKTQGEQN